MKLTYEECLDIGLRQEKELAKYIHIKYGYSIIPTGILGNYEKRGSRSMIWGHGELISPDTFIYKGEKELFSEMKYKRIFSYFKKVQDWTCGMDTYKFKDYMKINEVTPYKVHVFFWIAGGFSEDANQESPSGIYWCSLDKLAKNVHSFDAIETFWLADLFTKLDSIENAEKIIREGYGKKAA